MRQTFLTPEGIINIYHGGRQAMIQDVYADILFLINFSMDYLCLYICAKIMHRPLRLPRMLIASTLGGIYSVLALFLTVSPALDLLVDAAICFGMSAIAFSQKGRRFSSTLLCAFLFVGISMMTGGVMTAIFNLLNRLELPLGNLEADGLSTYLFAIIAAIAGIISLRSTAIMSRRTSIRECILTLTLAGKSLTCTAISDTGNLVKDPISGKRVVLIDRNTLSKLTDITEFDDFASGKPRDSSSLRLLRIVPIKTASGRSILVATLPDRLCAEVTTKKGKTVTLCLDALIAPSDIGRSAEGALAVIPAEILKF